MTKGDDNMSVAVLNRVIDNDLLIDEFALPNNWRGAKVELRIIKPTVSKIPWDEIPRIKAPSGRSSLDILQELREERF
ncbi:hypothetical protein SAMD00024442_10_20 [Candidatus Symbiothrix dinenymphae]|nr:hypothetical protein SAMD00024442_10_20 [Candidatus Symbiothrix dinenymphae]